MTTNIFSRKLQEFLNTQEYKITRDQRDEALNMIKNHFKKYFVISSGPCLQCGTSLDYKVSNTHLRQGDEWLFKLREKYSECEIRIKPHYKNDYTPTVCGYNAKSIAGYFCQTCRDDFETRISQKIQQQKQAKQKILDERLPPIEIANQILVKERKSTPYRRYEALCFILRVREDGEEIIKTLAEIPYKDFLQTIYWNVIREYMLSQAKYKCQLCTLKDELHVHHKTYEHHGQEHLYLEDLIVLCKKCHSKFHNRS